MTGRTWTRAAAVGAMAAVMTLAGAAADAASPGGRIEKLSGVWVEGPGYDITYGAAYDACAARCLADGRCVMIEYYRPERKCNLYDAERPRLKGGSSHVGIRRALP